MAVFEWVRRRNRDVPDLPEMGEPFSPVTPRTSTHDLPRFHSSGGELGRSSHSPERERLRDAFTPSQPVQEPKMFAGRSGILRTLIRSIEDLRLHVVIYGDRGFGKTSLLHLLTLLAREAHYHVAYHSCSERGNFTDTFRAIASEVPLLYDARFGPNDEETEGGATLARLLPEGDFSVSQLSEVFSHLSNTRLLVVLDEFDRSPTGEFRQSVAEFIKNVSDRSLRVQLIIAGVAGNLAELVEHIPSIRRNILGLQIPPMTPEEVREVIAIGEGISGLKFRDDASERIVKLANGSPYLASLLAQYAGFNAIDAERRDVKGDDVDTAATQVRGELRGRLSDKVLTSVDLAVADGLRPTLLALAKAAMGSMGRIDRDKLVGTLSDEDFVKVADHFAAYPHLIEQVEDGPAGRYRFVEEGLPVYLWVTLST